MLCICIRVRISPVRPMPSWYAAGRQDRDTHRLVVRAHHRRRHLHLPGPARAILRTSCSRLWRGRDAGDRESRPAAGTHRRATPTLRLSAEDPRRGTGDARWVFHGTAGTPMSAGCPGSENGFLGRGYSWRHRTYPGLNVDPIDTFLPTVLANHTFGADTVLVGHSGGAALLWPCFSTSTSRWPGRSWSRAMQPNPDTSEEASPAERLRLGRYHGSRPRTGLLIDSPEDPFGWGGRRAAAMFEQVGGSLDHPQRRTLHRLHLARSSIADRLNLT